MFEQDGGADENDIHARQFRLDAYLVGSRGLEAYRRGVERNRTNQAHSSSRFRARYCRGVKRDRKKEARSSSRFIARSFPGSEHDVPDYPGQIDHFFHPSCPLFPRRNCRFHCSACHRNFYDHCYMCRKCNFYMDVECALQALPVEEGRVGHFIHPHSLSVLPGHDHEENHLGVSQYSGSFCKICGEACRVGDTCPTVCACQDCQFYVHKSCLDFLPREVERHLFHKCASPLVFITRPRMLCDGCDEHGSGLCYSCRKCGFSMCLECSLLIALSNLKSRKEKQKKIQHFLHRHTLTLVEKSLVGTSCNACGLHAPPGLSYACRNCNFFLHRSCSELPHKLRTIFHLDHPLFLKNMASHRLDSQNSKCILCLKDCQGCFSYCCNDCNVLLDVECAFLKPTIEYQRHNHLLTVVESLHIDVFKCYACKKYRGGFPVFRCVECNFNLHLLCGPLPLEIKHKCHVHPLELLDYFVEDDRHDHCCHACELPRDPELCVYRCSDCLFIADVKCILSQVLLSLRGANGEVMLRTVGKRIPSRLVIDSTINKSDRLHADARGYMIMRHSQSSNNHVLKYFNMQAVSECSIDYVNGSLICNLKFRGKTSVRIQEDSFFYSDVCFKQLIKRLKLNSLVWDNQLQNFAEEHNKFVTFRDYMFPESLIPIFTRFLDKHGDISVSAKAKGHNIRSVYFYLLCCVLESMSTTKLLDVTEDQLTNWHACLDKVKKAGFNIQVVYDHLERVVRAHFGLRAQKFIDDTSNQLKGKIKSISDEIERLTKELEGTKRSLVDHEKFVKRETTSLIRQCLNDASKIKYIYAASGLI